MKKTILATLIALCILPLANAQNNNSNRNKNPQQCAAVNGSNANFEACTHENVQKLRIAYVTSRLDLTIEQSEKFWPISNEYAKKLNELGQRRRAVMLTIRENIVSDKELESSLDEWLAIGEETVDINNEYAKKLEKVLPKKQIIKAFIVEEKFKTHLLNKYHKRHKNTF